MASTQESNVMVAQSGLCICSRKWKTKLIVLTYFGTKKAKFCFRIISFSSLESEDKGTLTSPARLSFVLKVPLTA